MIGQVNSGRGRAFVEALQKCVGAKQDGGLGPLTLKKVSKKDPKELIEMLSVEREAFYRKLKPLSILERDGSEEIMKPEPRIS